MAEKSTCVRGEPPEAERAHSSSTDTKRKSIKKPTGWNSFFQSVAPDVKEQLGKEAGIGQVSKVVGNMWKKLPKDRRKTTTSFWTAPKPTTLSSGLRAFVAMAGISVFTILGTMMCLIHFKRKVQLQRARLAEDEKKSLLSWTE